MSGRTEIIGDATLILGDCREILPGLGKVDAVVTDPIWPNAPHGMFDETDPFGLLSDAILAARALRVVIVMRCDSDPRFLCSVPANLPFFRSIQLPYAMPGYLGRVLGGDETAYWFGSPISVAPGRRVVPGRAPSAQPSDRPPNGHPCSRAQIHFDWLVRWCSDAGETVCDPFMGSGTTGSSCVTNGRRFIGIEIHEPYFDIACRRIEAAWKQPRLFEEPKPKAIQEALL